jgi:hypothetical protein
MKLNFDQVKVPDLVSLYEGKMLFLQAKVNFFCYFPWNIFLGTL